MLSHKLLCLLVATATLAIAAPVPPLSTSVDAGMSCAASHPEPVLPSTNGTDQLPSPPPDVSLKHILLGYGIQNYTCSSPSSTPLAIGALAMLYDITSLYPDRSPASLSRSEFDSLPSTILSQIPIPLNMATTTTTTGGADPSSPWGRETPIHIDSLDRTIPFAGHHWFTASGVPEFRLQPHYGGVDFLGSKLAGVPAPTTADRGPDDTGAVAWLQLGAKDGSVGAKFVYRVVTAGGNSHGCVNGGATDSTVYTTQYWIYE